MNKKIFIIGILVLFSLGILCGCTENQHANIKDKFIGTWVGTMEFSMFNLRGNTSTTNFTENPVNFTMGPVSITELEFFEDTLYMLLITGNGTQTIPQTYSVDGDQLILSFQFTGERPSWRPPLNDSERPPFDRERPFDGESPFNGERPPMTRSYTYSFNGNNTILYLDGSEFIKIR